MNDQTTWTEDNFDEMSWHDCQVNSVALDQDGEWQSDLVFDIDFIVEWLCGTDKTYRFRVAPALLRFTNVDNLRLNVSLQFKNPMEISSVERVELATRGYRNFHWLVKMQRYADSQDNVIEFDATGFTQELIGHSIETARQNLTGTERQQSKAKWRASR